MNSSYIKEDNTSIKKISSSRSKQITYGKNTHGYLRYLMLVPKDKRGPSDPVTPDPYEDISKRRFEGKLKKWRKELHQYDPQTNEDLIELETYWKKLEREIPNSQNLLNSEEEEDEEDMRLWGLLDSNENKV